MSATCSCSVGVAKVKKVALSCFQSSVRNLYNVRTKVGLTIMITTIMIMMMTTTTATTRQSLVINGDDDDDIQCSGY